MTRAEFATALFDVFTGKNVDVPMSEAERALDKLRNAIEQGTLDNDLNNGSLIMLEMTDGSTVEITVSKFP